MTALLPASETDLSMLASYDLPEDPEWGGDAMLIRHAAALPGGRLDPATAERIVGILEQYGSGWGLVRHGPLSWESWDFGHFHGVASCFRIVDIQKFVDGIRRQARHEERENIRRWPWWRRLFMPRDKGKGVSHV